MRRKFGLSRFSASLLLSFGLLIALAASFAIYAWSEKEVDRANEHRYLSRLLADELRQSSDDLTRMARTYVVTGDPVYRQHFEDILAIRDGIKPRPEGYDRVYWDFVTAGDDTARPGAAPPIALLDRMKQAGFADQEFLKLAEAKTQSDRLTTREFRAFHLLETADQDEAVKAQARMMVHDREYHRFKAAIMKPINEFFILVDQRTGAAVQFAERRATLFRDLSVLVGLALSYMLWHTYGLLRRTMGASLHEVHAQIAALGCGDVSTEAAVSEGLENSVMGWLKETRRKLRNLDGERRRAEESITASRDQLNEAQRIARLGSWTLDLRSHRLEWSDEIYRIFEIDRQRFGASYDAFLTAVHPEDRETVNRAYSDSLAKRTPYELGHRLLLPDGRIKHVHERCETLYAADGTPVLSRGTVQDITDRKLAEEALYLYANAFQYSGEAILITDHDNRIIALNPAFTRDTGYTLDELRGKNPQVLASGHTPRETYQMMWAALGESGYWQGELWDRRKDGESYPKWTAISVIRAPDGAVTHYIANFTDISERKAAEERIHRLAHHDPLTGLFNRFSLENRLEQAMLSAWRESEQLAVMFIDMDRFKVINDTLGHHTGDALLIEVALRLQSAVRDSDIVARLGGDEFMVVLTGVGLDSAVAPIAEKIVRMLGQPYMIEGHVLHSSPSVGISIFPADGEDVETLMKNADTAMYHAKEQGRNNFQFFAATMTATAVERLALERDMRRALAENQFELYYQPKLRTSDGSISGVEALIRWRHPERGLIPPMKFIPIAEETGLIEAIGEWVLDEACRQQAIWRAQGIPNTCVAVNLSAHQLRSPMLVERVREIMAKHGIGAGNLEMEVTESAAMDDPERAVGQLTALRKLGVELAIDDFGTGYSSLAYLKLLPIQTLKLDRAFVRDIESDENDAAISAATLALAHNLGLKVVAEGVETDAQRAFLAAHRCDFLQGYWVSKPLPASEATAFLHRTGTAA